MQLSILCFECTVLLHELILFKPRRGKSERKLLQSGGPIPRISVHKQWGESHRCETNRCPSHLPEVPRTQSIPWGLFRTRGTEETLTPAKQVSPPSCRPARPLDSGQEEPRSQGPTQRIRGCNSRSTCPREGPSGGSDVISGLGERQTLEWRRN